MNHVEGNFQIVISEEKFAVRASILDQFTVESQFAEKTVRERERYASQYFHFQQS